MKLVFSEKFVMGYLYKYWIYDDVQLWQHYIDRLTGRGLLPLSF